MLTFTVLICLQVMRQYEASCRELRNMLLTLHKRMKAATAIQSFWKGSNQRQAFRPVWEQYQLGKRQQAAAVVIQKVIISTLIHMITTPCYDQRVCIKPWDL
jgi:hypothetical protein